MLTQKCPAWYLGGRSRRIPDANVVRAVALLAGLCVAAAASAQGVSDIELQIPLSIEEEGYSAQQGQQLPVPPPVAPSPPTRAESKHSLSKELAQKVEALVAKRDFDKAIAAIDEVLKTESGNAELHRLRATVHCRAGNLNFCLQDADRAVASDQDIFPHPPVPSDRAHKRRTGEGRTQRL